MASVNKVILIGNLGKDPETRYTENGTAVTSCSIATSERWKDKQTGEQKEQTEWHRLTFWGRLGEVAGEYLRKGSSIYVEGKLTTRKWTDKEGQERYTTEVKVEDLKLLGSKRDGDDSHDAPPARPAQRQQARHPAARPAPASGAHGDDDVAF